MNCLCSTCRLTLVPGGFLQVVVSKAPQHTVLVQAPSSHRASDTTLRLHMTDIRDGFYARPVGPQAHFIGGGLVQC
jgi:hypothetical protein